MNTEAFLAAQLARPITHRVTTLFESGETRIHNARSIGAAENWAIGERRKIGKTLIRRDSGETVKVIAVTIDLI